MEGRLTYDFRFCWLIVLVELHGSVDLEFLIKDSRWHLITEQSLLGVGLLRASRPPDLDWHLLFDRDFDDLYLQVNGNVLLL